MLAHTILLGAGMLAAVTQDTSPHDLELGVTAESAIVVSEEDGVTESVVTGDEFLVYRRHFRFVPPADGDYWMEVRSPLGLLPVTTRTRPGAPWRGSYFMQFSSDTVRPRLIGLKRGEVCEVRVSLRDQGIHDALRPPDGLEIPFTVTVRSDAPPTRPGDRLPVLRRMVEQIRGWDPPWPLALAHQLEELAKVEAGWMQFDAAYEDHFHSRSELGFDGSELDQAEEHLSECVALFSSAAPDKPGLRVDALVLAGDLASHARNHSRAIELFEAALDCSRKSGLPQSWGRSEPMDLNWRYLAALEAKGGRRAVEEQLEKLERIAMESSRGYQLYELSRVALAWWRLGDEARAVALADRCSGAPLTDLRWLGRGANPYEVFPFIRLLLVMGREHQLASPLEFMVETTPLGHGDTGLSKTIRCARMVREVEGRDPSGRVSAAYAQLDRIFKEKGWDRQYVSEFGLLSLAAGRDHYRFGATGAALRDLRQGVDALTRSGTWPDARQEGEANLWLARAALTEGEFDEAREHAERAFDWADADGRASTAAVAEIVLAAVDLHDGDGAAAARLIAAIAAAGDVGRSLLLDAALGALAGDQPEFALRLLDGATASDASATDDLLTWRTHLLRAAALVRLDAAQEAGERLDDLARTLAGLEAPGAGDVRAEALLQRGVLEARADRFVEAAALFRASLDAALQEPTAFLAIERGDSLRRRARRLRQHASTLLAVLLREGSLIDAEDHRRLVAAKGAANWLRAVTREGLHAALDAGQRSRLGRLREIQNEFDPGDPGALRSERRGLEQELAAIGLHAAPWLEVADLGRALPPGAGLIDAYQMEPKPWSAERWLPFVDPGPPASVHMVACVVRGRDGARYVIDLGDQASLEQALDAYVANTLGVPVRSRGEPVPVASTTPEECRERLWSALWEPVREQLGSHGQTVVSPDGPLSGFPIGLLRNRRGQYLLEKQRITYLDGSWQLEHANQKFPAAELSSLLIGGVDLTVRSLPWGEEAQELDPLPGSRAEVEAIAGLYRSRFRNARKLELLTGKQAQESAVVRRMSSIELLHLATHGLLLRAGRDPSVGLAEYQASASGLLLGHSADRSGDGWLSAEEIAWSDGERWQMVVLSACHGARGHELYGEGLASLRRGFHLAGARRVISACWAVPDEETGRLMGLFYENLWKRRRPPEDALRQAQLTLLRESRKSGDADGAPGTWGAWILSGSWR